MATGRVDVTSLHEGTGTVIYDKPSSVYVVVTASASLMSHSCFMPPAKILSGQLLRYYINAVFFWFACLELCAQAGAVPDLPEPGGVGKVQGAGDPLLQPAEPGHPPLHTHQPALPPPGE